MSENSKLSVLKVTDYNLIANKDPRGSYDRKTRENLYRVIEQLRGNPCNRSHLEQRLFQKFKHARFLALEDKEKKVRFEVARYRLSKRVKDTLKITASAVVMLIAAGWLVYQFLLDEETRREIDFAYYAGLNRIGLASKEGYERIRTDLETAALELAKTKRNNQELSQMVEQMIANNKVTENLKYIIKRVHNDPHTQYIRKGDHMGLYFNKRKIASYKSDPNLWYILGIVDSGMIRVYYDDEEILEIESIFGRAGEETPIGEYRIVNKVYKPTWYKKERIGGKVKVRAIPFGHEDHEIGHWWMGMKKIGAQVPGSYGLHGVNTSKVNEFYKKNFDWRNGSAGCPNIQEWYLHFLAKMVPEGTRVNIVQKDKWRPHSNTLPRPAA